MGHEAEFDAVGRAGSDSNSRSRLVFDSGVAVEISETKQGGMGLVHFGTCVIGGDSIDVAVKSIRQEYLLNPAVRAAFLNEASVWSQLSGLPFVLPLISIEERKGFHYLVTVWVPADENGDVSLRDRINRGPGRMPIALVFEVALALATGMARARKHLPGLVHGDIKPENVLMLGEMAHLADFGIAKIKLRHAGTPHDASAPELTGQDDISGFGYTIFECLTGIDPGVGNKTGDLSELTNALARAIRTAASRDRPLMNGVAQIALACTCNDPERRPGNFGEIAGFLFELGMEHAPEIANKIYGYCEFCDNQIQDVESSEAMVLSQMRHLLNSEDPEAALALVDRVPESERSPEFWLSAGTASSLSGNDEQALMFFDHCLAPSTVGSEMWIRCNSEKGLSLRRLRRYDEAISLHEELLRYSLGPSLKTVMGNYVGTLLDAERIEDASRRSIWLTEKFPEEATIWILRGQVEKARGRYQQACTSLKRAISLSPGASRPHLLIAQILQVEFGDLAGALEHLDLAFATGEHDPQLVASLLAVNMLLGHEDNVDGLLKALKPLRKEIYDSISSNAMSQVRAFVNKFAKEAPKEAGVDSGASESPNDGKSISSGVASPPVVLETAVCFVEGSQLPMMAARVFLNSELFVLDYYDEVGGADYANNFGRFFAQFTNSLALQFGKLHLRNSMFRILSCIHCGARVLSNRSDTENLLCRSCEEKGQVTPSTFGSTEALVQACEKAAQLMRVPVSGQIILFSFWPPSEEATETVKRIASKAAWKSLPEDSFARSMATHFGRDLGASITSEPQMQMTLEIPKGEESYGGTPWSAQQLLLMIHPILGVFPTSTMVVSRDMARYLDCSREEALQRIRQDSAETLQNPDNLANLIHLTFHIDPVETKRLVALSRTLSARNSPRLVAARGWYLLEMGDLGKAEEELRRAKELAPLDIQPRLDLVKIMKLQGRDEEAEDETEQLRAIGLHWSV